MTSLTGHHNPDPAATPTTPGRNPGWLSVSAAFTAAVPPLAERDDLTVIVEPGAAAGSPACYLPHQATIEIDGALLGTPAPPAVDPHDPATADTYPVAFGALVHEAAHARHTRWDFTAGQPAVNAAAVLLEESRIEAAHLRRRPSDRRWLRAAIGTIVLADIPDTDDTWTAANAAALICARVDAGVLHAAEARPARTAARRILRTPTLTELRRIWRQAHRTADGDTDAMLELGRRWCHALGLDPTAAPGPGDGQQPGAPAPARRRGGGSIRRAATRSVAAVAATDTDDSADRARDAAARRAAARDAHTAQQATARAAAAAVFGPPTPKPAGSPPRTRPATAAERAAAGQLARALRAAAHREPVTTTTTSPTPPGRLRTRAALAADAQRAAGQQPTAEPWQRTTRRHTPQPPIHVGICADVSLSMTAWAPAVAAAAWVTAQATACARGASATVTFGEHVTAITRPGQPPDQVRLFDIEPATRGLPTAIDALDHTLGLSDPRAGARLLVIVSDGDLLDPNDPPPRPAWTGSPPPDAPCSGSPHPAQPHSPARTPPPSTRPTAPDTSSPAPPPPP